MLAERIAESWTGLSPQEQRVAEFLRQRPDESALYNSSELARLTGVSKATVSRLFRRLGFAGSHEVRDLLRARRGTGVPVAVDAADDGLGAQLARDVENLRRCYAALDASALGAAARALADARRVVVVGFRSAYPLAQLLRQALAQVRADVRLVPEPGQSVAEELVGLGHDDVVVVLALRRRPAALGAVLDAAAVSPARVLVLADPTLPIRPTADWRLEVPIESASAFDSYAAVASVMSLLAGTVLEAAGADAARRVQRIGALYGELGELEQG